MTPEGFDTIQNRIKVDEIILLILLIGYGIIYFIAAAILQAYSEKR